MLRSGPAVTWPRLVTRTHSVMIKDTKQVQASGFLFQTELRDMLKVRLETISKALQPI